MQDVPQIGQLITDNDRRRDAIHVALAPVTANTRLKPGERVGLVRDDSVEFVGIVPTGQDIGIVDPYLTIDVEKGERFWLFLYPNSVTGLRHVWSHPTFAAAAANFTQRHMS